MRKFLVTYSQNNVWKHLVTNNVRDVSYLFKKFEYGYIDELIVGQYKTEDKEDEVHN